MASANDALPTKKRQNAQLTEAYAASLLPEGGDTKRTKDKETITTVCIIGPASDRHVNFASSTSNKLTSEVFDAMVKHTTRWIEINLLGSSDTSPLDWSSIRLSSSGAAWCDHVAIAIYLDKHALGATLTLHLPCDFVDGKFFDDKSRRRSGRDNPGGIVNDQHAKFMATLGRDTLAEMKRAKSLGATLQIVEKGGFFACSRALVHECDELIAFGWAGEGSTNQEPSSPGTTYTWSLAPKWTRKHFVNLNTLQ